MTKMPTDIRWYIDRDTGQPLAIWLEAVKEAKPFFQQEGGPHRYSVMAVCLRAGDRSAQQIACPAEWPFEPYASEAEAHDAIGQALFGQPGDIDATAGDRIFEALVLRNFHDGHTATIAPK